MQLQLCLPVLIKALLVSLESVPEEEDPKLVNWLAFATGLLLGTFDDVFDQKFDDHWKKISIKYIKTVYAQLSTYGPDSVSIHKKLRHFPSVADSLKMVKKMSIVKWLKLLESFTQQKMHENVKCLFKYNMDNRIRLPDFMTRERPTEEVLKEIESFVDGAGSKPSSS